MTILLWFGNEYRFRIWNWIPRKGTANFKLRGDFAPYHCDMSWKMNLALMYPTLYMWCNLWLWCRILWHVIIWNVTSDYDVILYVIFDWPTKGWSKGIRLAASSFRVSSKDITLRSVHRRSKQNLSIIVPTILSTAPSLILIGTLL